MQKYLTKLIKILDIDDCFTPKADKNIKKTKLALDCCELMAIFDRIV